MSDLQDADEVNGTIYSFVSLLAALPLYSSAVQKQICSGEWNNLFQGLRFRETKIRHAGYFRTEF